MAKTFALSNHQGFSTLLTDREAHVTQLAQPSGVENLSVLTSGPKPPNPSEMLGSIRMGQVMEQLRESYDLIIFDMPPVVAVTDAQIMSALVDGTMLVVREGVSDKRAIIKAQQLLDMVNANLLGVVYNGATKATDQGYNYYGA